VGCTTGSREEIPGERKPVIRDDDDNETRKNYDRSYKVLTRYSFGRILTVLTPCIIWIGQ